jgi:hypothetical protein
MSGGGAAAAGRKRKPSERPADACGGAGESEESE